DYYRASWDDSLSGPVF
nr:immunoglobulin light chain junction region [Macaca mulatta]